VLEAGGKRLALVAAEQGFNHEPSPSWRLRSQQAKLWVWIAIQKLWVWIAIASVVKPFMNNLSWEPPVLR